MFFLRILGMFVGCVLLLLFGGSLVLNFDQVLIGGIVILLTLFLVALTALYAAEGPTGRSGEVYKCTACGWQGYPLSVHDSYKKCKENPIKVAGV